METAWKESVVLLQALGDMLLSINGDAPLERTPKMDGHVDLLVCLIYTVGLLVLNWGLRLVVIDNVAWKVLSKTTPKKVEKFTQSVMEIIFYGVFSVIGLIIVPNQPWAWPSALWWKGYSQLDMTEANEFMRMSDALSCFYILYAARYLQNIVSVLIEHKRKDFLEMQIHHITTALIVAISYVYGWYRIGAIIMLLLDPADVPLQAAKLSKYIGEGRCPGVKSNWWQFWADRLFETFALTFFVTRLVLYPYVVWSAHFESRQFFPHGGPEIACLVLLNILLVLQVYWFALIMRVAWKLLVLGHAEDVRSDDEDDASSAAPIATKKKA